MIAHELINHMIPPLKPTDDSAKAIAWMEELRVKELPVINDDSFLGLISEDIIFTSNELSSKVGDFLLTGRSCFVYEDKHLYDVMKVSTDNDSQVVAVLDKTDHYQGVITIQDALIAFAQSAAVQSQGGILVLSMKKIDYSMAELARLIEADDVKILSSSIQNDPLDPEKIKLTLKLNTIDVSRTAATLERFNYKIIATFEESLGNDVNQERLDILFKYLDI
ncbi:CBS domain-containing protein [Marinigracilibium pacificum]|uniref:CBS domain-containing protein n=1 Tax=Marinigracilibium pacificum TaxID=2729599 RepID=A0A848IZT0_9BACT|nr:CBS domain-containing protein [Marinigracilibium pacificum]NMM49797.1 CBS domain-containing protein [Marinigracilibium pacificum]